MFYVREVLETRLTTTRGSGKSGAKVAHFDEDIPSFMNVGQQGVRIAADAIAWKEGAPRRAPGDKAHSAPPGRKSEDDSINRHPALSRPLGSNGARSRSPSQARRELDRRGEQQSPMASEGFGAAWRSRNVARAGTTASGAEAAIGSKEIGRSGTTRTDGQEPEQQDYLSRMMQAMEDSKLPDPPGSVELSQFNVLSRPNILQLLDT